MYTEPGTFEFAKPSLLFKESAGKALIPVERSNGADGHVELEWKTEDLTAKSGKDFEGGSGKLVFEHGEMTKTLEIAIFDDQVNCKYPHQIIDTCSHVLLLGSKFNFSCDQLHLQAFGTYSVTIWGRCFLCALKIRND